METKIEAIKTPIKWQSGALKQMQLRVKVYSDKINQFKQKWLLLGKTKIKGGYRILKWKPTVWNRLCLIYSSCILLSHKETQIEPLAQNLSLQAP